LLPIGSTKQHGDPVLATAEKGEKIIALTAQRLATFIRFYRQTDASQVPVLFPDV